MTTLWLTELLRAPIDAAGFALFLLVFPIYHGLYPWLMRWFPNRAAKTRVDAYRHSWIEGLVERHDILAAAQQTRNLTMVNSLLASSSLILMGITANLLLSYGAAAAPLEPGALGLHPDALAAKLFLLIVVFGVAFAYCMTSLRHLGHFNLVIGADPAVIERLEGSAVDYFSALINRASNRYTLATRCLFSASPIFLWLFDSRFFIAVTLFWGAKFIILQDFAHVRRRPAAGA